jgi:hypothetical protein
MLCDYVFSTAVIGPAPITLVRHSQLSTADILILYRPIHSADHGGTLHDGFMSCLLLRVGCALLVHRRWVWKIFFSPLVLLKMIRFDLYSVDGSQE